MYCPSPSPGYDEEAFLQGAQIPFRQEGQLEPKTWALDVLIAPMLSLLQNPLSRTRKHECVCTHTPLSHL